MIPQGAEVFLSTGTVNLNSFNLLGDSSKTTSGALRNVRAGATDILATSNGTRPTALAGILAPLADNGGPTRTHALDFIVWNTHKFKATGRWSQADWDANGLTDGQDFILWNARKFQSSDTSALIVMPGFDLDHRQSVAAGVPGVTKSPSLPARHDLPQIFPRRPSRRQLSTRSH